MTTIINTKLGEHRGKKRVWLEGTRIAREQVQAGLKYTPVVKNDRVVLLVGNEGMFTVSKREKNGVVHPIIDLKIEELATLFAGVERLRVVVRRGRIVITAHHSYARSAERVDRLIEKLSQGKPLDVGTAFSGGAVLDRAIHEGLASAGIKSRLSLVIEREGKYLDSAMRNNSMLWDENTLAINSDIEQADISHASQTDIVIMGIPCTGASRSGLSKNKLKYAEEHETAGAMFFYALRFIEVLNPAIIILENVTEYMNTSSYAVIRAVLTTWGYDVQERVLAGGEFGALENRKRLCVVATCKSLPIAFDSESIVPVAEKPACLGDLLDDVPANDKSWKFYDYLVAKETRDKANGNMFRRQLVTEASTEIGTIGRGYNKARSTEPFLQHPTDSALSRLLTVAEHCRVKGIPLEMVKGLSATIAHEVLGQSVIFPAFKAVGRSLGEFAQALAQDVMSRRCA